MSVILASGEQISKSPLNTSKSKQLYSFPKAQRFADPRSQSCATFYEIPEVRMKRTTTLGYGSKYDFTKDSKDKNVPYYHMPSDFDTKRSSSPKYTFGISRELYGKVYYETNKMFDKDVPGPGKYNYLKAFGSESSKFSMSGKFGMNKDKGINPGPGQYAYLAINQSGKYPLSQVKNTPTISIGTKSERFKYDCKIY